MMAIVAMALATAGAYAVPAYAAEVQIGDDVQAFVPFATAPISDEMLGKVAGREDTTQVAQADQAATVTRNSIGDNSVTGEVRISDNAFQNMSGLSVLNVNTGNNVAINASMNVNISLPTP